MATQEPPRKRRALVLDGFVSEGRRKRLSKSFRTQHCFVFCVRRAILLLFSLKPKKDDLLS
jgi:hypothetical protein